MGWTPEQFWHSTVPEFWAGVDWITEKNLEIEERLDEAKAGGSRPAANEDDVRDAIAQSQGRATAYDAVGDYRIPRGHERVKYNPRLRVKPNPGFVAWRERLRTERGI